VASENHIFKLSNAGGFKSLTRYYDMLAGNTTWNPWSPTGAFDALATVTLSATTASVTFSGIPTGYKHLQIRAITRTSSGNFNDLLATVNGDSGSNYSWHRLLADGGSVSAGAVASTTAITIGVDSSPTQTSGVFAVNIIDILDYASTSKNKTFRALTGVDNNGSGYVIYYSGAWYNSSTAINSITFTPQAGAGSLVSGTQFALFGVK
jgi:hypothetical protein